MAKLFDLGNITGKSIDSLRYDGKDENGGNIYSVILEGGKVLGTITAPQGDVEVSNRGDANGVASLDENALVPSNQLPFAKLHEGLDPSDDCRGAVIISIVNNTAHIWTYGKEKRG